MGAGLIWHRIGSSGGFLWIQLMNVNNLKLVGNILTTWATISFSRTPLTHNVTILIILIRLPTGRLYNSLWSSSVYKTEKWTRNREVVYLNIRPHVSPPKLLNRSRNTWCWESTLKFAGRISFAFAVRYSGPSCYSVTTYGLKFHQG